jgi:carboxypeptidase Taq
MTKEEAYTKLCAWSAGIGYLSSAMALLHWDHCTYIPKKGASHRAEVMAHLAGIRHRTFTDPHVADLLAAVDGTDLTDDPLSVEAVNIREWKRNYSRAVKIPEKLATDLAKAGADGQTVWEEARPANDWKAFEPRLELLVDLKKEEADLIGYDTERYDALLDLFEPGETSQSLEPKFKRLIPALVELLSQIKGKSPAKGLRIEDRKFQRADQEAFAIAVAESIGYDMKGGRLDVSAHPFTTGIGPGDVRITTRYSENDFNEAFFAVIHEAGHAMYHQGLPLDHWGTPFCSPSSLSINESQSRMWENMVARSMGFWKHFFPVARQKFPCLAEVELEDFYFSFNEVTPNFIRVEADEVTYNIHVLLRFELELALMRNDLSVKDLPEAWNEKMTKYLGLTPPNFSLGVMQDVHWSGGAIGYFPTYTLGNMYAAQFFAKAQEELGDLEAGFAEGNFADLLSWLRKNIHGQGGRYRPRDLIETVTGNPLDPDYLIDYLNKKYAELYRL